MAIHEPLSLGSSEPRWLSVGEPPAPVLAEMERRAARIRPVLAAVGAVLVGGMVGYVVLLLAPPSLTGSGLFLAFAIPVGVAEFFLTVRYLRWLDRRLRLAPARIAIVAGRLRGELPAAGSFDVPLAKVQLGREPVAGGWYTVSVPQGRARRFFLVPAPVASEIRSSAPFG